MQFKKIKLFFFIFISLYFYFFIFFSTFEIILYCFNYDYHPLKIVAPQQMDWRSYHALEDSLFVYDSFLFWRPKKNHSVFNSQGFRGKEFNLKKNHGERRLLVLGDSNTLGEVTPNGNGSHWPDYLQKLLDKTSEEFCVVNAGVAGYSLFQGQRLFKKLLFLKPEIVFISFGSNDGAQVLFLDREFAERKIRRIKNYQFLEKFKTGQAIIELLDKFSPLIENRDFLVFRVNLVEYRNYLEEIIKIAKKNKIKIILLTRPFLGKPDSQFDIRNFVPSYNRIVRDIARKENLLLIDIYSYFANQNLYFKDNNHFNKMGYQKTAEIIFKAIKNLKS